MTTPCIWHIVLVSYHITLHIRHAWHLSNHTLFSILSLIIIPWIQCLLYFICSRFSLLTYIFIVASRPALLKCPCYNIALCYLLSISLTYVTPSEKDELYLIIELQTQLCKNTIFLKSIICWKLCFHKPVFSIGNMSNMGVMYTYNVNSTLTCNMMWCHWELPAAVDMVATCEIKL